MLDTLVFTRFEPAPKIGGPEDPRLHHVPRFFRKFDWVFGVEGEDHMRTPHPKSVFLRGQGCSVEKQQGDGEVTAGPYAFTTIIKQCQLRRLPDAVRADGRSTHWGLILCVEFSRSRTARSPFPPPPSPVKHKRTKT